jgi:hydrogenase expression/formation protein HypC
MCLAVPMRLTEVKGANGKAELDGVARRVRLDFVPEAKPGDFVLLHAGYAIQVMDQTAAEETLGLLNELLGPEDQARGI